MSTPDTKIEQLTDVMGGRRGSELLIGDVPVSEIAKQVGTPFYAYSGDSISTRVQRVLKAFGPGVGLVFSIKANPSLAVCQVIARQGIGCEVASIGELLLAREAGFPANRILFIGPGKSDEELEQAVNIGIEAVIVESEGELERLDAISRRFGKQMRVGIRINVATQVKGYQMRMGGGPQPFGVDEEQVDGLIQRFRDAEGVRIIGLHVYAGSQMFDLDALMEHCGHVVELAQNMADSLGHPIEMIDFGGGFGVPYFAKLEEFDLVGFGEQFATIVEQLRNDKRLTNAHPVIELGRYIVAESGIYITRVLDIKKSREKTFVITDGGMNHHVAATGNFGQVFRRPYPLAIVNKLDEVPVVNVAVVGPNCTPLDVFAQDVELQNTEIGDLLGVFYSGAYGYSVSGLGFLSHPKPAEVMAWQGELHVIREAGDARWVLDGQVPLAESANSKIKAAVAP